MKIEYLHEGSPDCPLIRIFDFTTSEVLLLKEHIHDLSCDSAHTFAIHDMPGVNAIGALRFTFTVGNRDVGVKGRMPDFRCEFTPSRWGEIEELINPFVVSPSMGCFQWLDDSGEVTLLLSPGNGGS